MQTVPVIGAIISVPTALFSGIVAIGKIAQAVFQRIKNGTPFFRSLEEKNQRHPKTSMENAIDHSIIFLNNVINIGTWGILNNIMVNHVISFIHCGGGND